MIRLVGGLDAPDERGEVGKDVSTRTVLLDGQKIEGETVLELSS